jgi:hypothetical protein
MMSSVKRSSTNLFPADPTSLGDMISLCSFAVFIIIRYHSAINSFWLYDDPQILRHAFDHSPWEYFLVPDVWREMSLRSLTPWVSLSFYMDLKLFGFHPRFFYLHQLGSIWLASAGIYLLLRFWTSRLFAVFGGLLFVASAPVAAAAELLMVRHYIEGLIFALGAICCFTFSLRRNLFSLSILSSAFYFFAISAKELYVPLLVLAVALPEDGLRKRVAYAVPHALVFVLYLAWRYWMLGDVSGVSEGETAIRLYRTAGVAGLLIRDIYATLIMMSGFSFTGGITVTFAAVSLLFFYGLSFFFLVKEKKYSALVFFVLLFVAAYSVPLAAFHPSLVSRDFTGYRIVFLIAACLSVSLSFAIFFLYRKISVAASSALTTALRGALVVSALAVLALVQWNSHSWISLQREKVVKPLVQEGRFFMSAGHNALLDKSNPVYCQSWYFENLEFFKKWYYNEDVPSVAYDGFAYLDAGTAAVPTSLKIYRYNPATGVMTDNTESFLKERALYLSRVRTLPLSVRYTVDCGLIDVSLGPSREGHYFLLWGHKSGLYSMYIDLGSVKEINTRGFTQMKAFWRFGWESPEGTVTLSPEWFVDFSKYQEIRWQQ